MSLKTNYLGHDRQYRLRREIGQKGWDTTDGVAETLAEAADKAVSAWRSYTANKAA